MDCEYFRIKNWEKFQHRDHRKSMPWIKLHLSIITDPTYNSLSSYQKLSWISLIILSAQTENKIKHSECYVRQMLNLPKPVDLALFESLGLIEKIPARSGRGEDAVGPRLEERRCGETAPNHPKHIEKYDESKENYSSSSSSSSIARPSEHFRLIELWNKYAKHKHIGLFSKRTDLLVKSLSEHPDFEYWERVFKAAAASEFLSTRKWKVTLEWVLINHPEIGEGKYNDEPIFKRKIDIIRPAISNESAPA